MQLYLKIHIVTNMVILFVYFASVERIEFFIAHIRANSYFIGHKKNRASVENYFIITAFVIKANVIQKYYKATILYIRCILRVFQQCTRTKFAFHAKFTFKSG